MLATQRTHDILTWHPTVDVEETERAVDWLEQRIRSAEAAIAAQRRIIEHDGNLLAYRLSLGGLERELLDLEGKLAQIMKTRSAELLEFALDGDDYRTHRASASALAKFIGTMQVLYSRVGQAVSTSKITRAIPKDITRQCALDVVAFYPSSFGVRFVADTQPDLVGYSLATAAMEATFDLVRSDNPVEQAARLGTYAIAKYRELVNILLEAKATPKVAWRNPAGQVREWITDHNSLLVLANRLAHLRHSEPEIKEARGILTGASLRRRRFEFNSEGGLITGIAPKELAPQLTECFGRACAIAYSEIVFVDETTDTEKRSRTLISATLIPPQTR